MYCLSVRNPFSYLICAGVKDVENRSWQTQYRGKILIHSCGNQSVYCLEDKDFPEKFLQQRDDNKTDSRQRAMDRLTKIIDRHYGVKNGAEYNALLDDKTRLKNIKPFFKCMSIIGEVTIADIVKNSKSPFAEPGLYHWILTKPVLYAYNKTFDMIRGKLGLWNFTQEVPNG
jgi:hypothetical protein